MQYLILNSDTQIVLALSEQLPILGAGQMYVEVGDDFTLDGNVQRYDAHTGGLTDIGPSGAGDTQVDPTLPVDEPPPPSPLQLLNAAIDAWTADPTPENLTAAFAALKTYVNG